MRARLTLHDPGDQADEDETPEEHVYRTALNPSEKRILTRVNSNYAKPGETIELVIRNGAFFPVAIDPNEAAKRGPMRQDAVKAKFIELMAQIKTEGRYVNNTPQHAHLYAPRVFAPHPHNRQSRFTKKEFEIAMRELLAANKIRLQRVGPAGHDHGELVVV